MVPRTIRSYAELRRLFDEMQVPHVDDVERQTIAIGTLRLAWEKAHPFLHIVQPIAVDVPADVERLVCEMNHGAMLPVLDWDAAARVLSVRVTTPLLVDGVRLDLLQALLAGVDARAKQLAARFASPKRP